VRPIIELRPLAAPPTAPAPPVSALRLRRSLAWPVGQAEAELSPAVAPPDAGELIVITAGTAEEPPTPVFTGRVLHHQRGLWSIRLVAEEPTGALARTHVAKAVRSATAAGLITDLCGAAGVPCTAEPPGALLPSYTLLDNQSVLEHINRLADMSGMLCRTDTQGNLRVETPLPVPTGTILRPVDPVLDLQVEHLPVQTVKIAGDGALGARGPGAEHWVLQSLDAITAGDGDTTRHLPGLKTMADVTRAATIAAMLTKESATRITLTLGGAPPCDLAEVILLMGFDAYTGPARVVGIDLLWSADSGLITTLELHGVGG
jgi:hypothetical protein